MELSFILVSPYQKTIAKFTFNGNKNTFVFMTLMVQTTHI